VAIAGELDTAVQRAFAALPEDYREVLRLTRQNHMSIAGAATCLGRTREATKKLYARALARLTALLAQGPGEGR
jgi:DNA-directed RNA polymerase specialized sigma24 family protein